MIANASKFSCSFQTIKNQLYWIQTEGWYYQWSACFPKICFWTKQTLVRDFQESAIFAFNFFHNVHCFVFCTLDLYPRPKLGNEKHATTSKGNSDQLVMMSHSIVVWRWRCIDSIEKDAAWYFICWKNIILLTQINFLLHICWDKRLIVCWDNNLWAGHVYKTPE